MVTVFLVLLTPHYPWYYLAAAPFLAIYPRALTLWAITVGALQIHDVIPDDLVPDYGQRQIAFHAVVLLAILWDLRGRTSSRPDINLGGPRQVTISMADKRDGIDPRRYHDSVGGARGRGEARSRSASIWRRPTAATCSAPPARAPTTSSSRRPT